MQITLLMFSGLAFALLAFVLIGGPMVLTDWAPNRREAVIARQIALTEVLDGHFGAVVAPVVTRSLFGPWEIRIALPLHRSAILARVLALIDEVFSGVEGRSPSFYRILLSVTPDVRRAASSGSPVGMRVDNLAPASSR